MSSGRGAGPNQDKEFEGLDLSTIRFPSDDLTIGTLRRMHPALFDKGIYSGHEAQPRYFLQADEPGHAEDDLGSLLICERLVAANAYADGRGIARPGGWDYADPKQELTDSYPRFGIARGGKHAKELIRDIERQAKLLANQRDR